MDDFCAARSRTIPPLPWSSFPPPFSVDAVLSLLDMLVPIRPDIELCLCDTTGKATPDQVEELFRAVQGYCPHVTNLAMHAHDTYGLGTANVFAAWRAGVRIFDSSFAGLGGCPFAPGATGNVATEDLIWMFSRMKVNTGISLDRLLGVAATAASIPGSSPGGRVRFSARTVSVPSNCA